MGKYTENGWEISLAENWQSEFEEGLPTIYHPDGYGAIQINSFSKDNVVNEDDLIDLANDHIEAGAKYKVYEQNDSSVLTLAFGHEDIF